MAIDTFSVKREHTKYYKEWYALRWRQKGHEFDECASVYQYHFSGKRFYIFGAGKLGKEYADFLHSNYVFDDAFLGFIDNDPKKHGEKYCEEYVISLDEYIRSGNPKSSFIVLCVSRKNMPDVIKQLQNAGMIDKVDFVSHEEYFQEIFPLLFLYDFHKVYLQLCQIVLTERCTLRCKKCAHASNLVPRDTEDISSVAACKSADAFFSFVDYIQEFVLIGGEPFLYEGLAQVISYIGHHYREKMYIFSITTNGTLIPDENVLQLCKQYDVLIRISNYSNAIPALRKRYDLLMNKLTDYNISYDLAPLDKQWMDYGFEYVNRKASPDVLEGVFDACHTPCHEIRKDRFYYCVMARSVAENMRRDVGEEDYLDIGQLSPDNLLDKRIFFEYAMGYSDKGYLDMCNFCHGAESRNFPIPAAEQMEG